VVLEFKSAEFTKYVSFLKRIDDISDSYYIKNDVWIPSTRTNQNKPGVHIIQDPFYNTDDALDNVTYRCTKLCELSKTLGDIKGKKTGIAYERDMTGIYISISDIKYTIAVVPDSIPQSMEIISTFESKIYDNGNTTDKDWVNFTFDELTLLKSGGPITLSIPNGDMVAKVRVGKSLFKLSGTTSYSKPVNYTSKYNVAIVPPNENNEVMGILTILVNYDRLTCLHRYMFEPYI
jgi:hypothetical protein